MSIVRIQDDEKGVTPVFEMFPVINHDKSKEKGRPIFDEIEMCRIHLAANKQTVGAFPAHDVWQMNTQRTEWGTDERVPITYAMRFNKQYLEFKSGGKQSFSGTLLSELPFLTSAKRLELKALNIHTAEALSGLDGAALKMLGPGGRDLKNQALAYIEKAKEGVSTGRFADEMSKKDEQIAELTRRLDSMAAPVEASAVETKPVSEKAIGMFATFEDDDIQAWLADGGVTVDKRWGRNTLIAKAEELLEQTGKQKNAA
jgi:hypothetical protein